MTICSPTLARLLWTIRTNHTLTRKPGTEIEVQHYKPQGRCRNLVSAVAHCTGNPEGLKEHRSLLGKRAKKQGWHLLADHGKRPTKGQRSVSWHISTVLGAPIAHKNAVEETPENKGTHRSWWSSCCLQSLLGTVERRKACPDTESEESQATKDCWDMLYIEPRTPLLGLTHAEGFLSKGEYRPFHPLLVAKRVRMSSRRSSGHFCQRRTTMYLCIVTHLGILDEELDGFCGALGADLSPFYY